MSLHPGIWSFFMRHVCFFNCHCVLEVWVFEEFLAFFFNWKKGKTSPTASRGNMQKTKCLTQRPPSPQEWEWRGENVLMQLMKRKTKASRPLSTESSSCPAGRPRLWPAQPTCALGSASPLRVCAVELDSTFVLFSSPMYFYIFNPIV